MAERVGLRAQLPDRVAEPATERPELFYGADPFITFDQKRGLYYLVQSRNKATQIAVWATHILPDRVPGEPAALFTPGREDTKKQIWATELHFDEEHEKWTFYWAGSNGRNESHRMFYGRTEDPLSGKFEEEERIRVPDQDYWAIDMTVMRHTAPGSQPRMYAVWSGWENPEDGFPQNLYIAKMENPHTIMGPRVKISTPDKPWETFVRKGKVVGINEGPQILYRPNMKPLLFYSANRSWLKSYCLGALELVGDDPLEPVSWLKYDNPIFTGNGLPGGAGHCSFVQDEVTKQNWMYYHRKTEMRAGWADRVIARTPYELISGMPIFGKTSVSTDRNNGRLVYSAHGRLATAI